MPWANDPDDRKESNRRYGADWRRKRLACLKAARWRCQIGLEGCTITATEVDHVDQAWQRPGSQQPTRSLQELPRQGHRAAGQGLPQSRRPAPQAAAVHPEDTVVTMQHARPGAAAGSPESIGPGQQSRWPPCSLNPDGGVGTSDQRK